MLEDHEFHPKLGLKSGERAPKLFVPQVLAAAQLAGHVGRSWPARPSAGYTGASRGRGGVAALRTAERRLYGSGARRVIVKAPHRPTGLLDLRAFDNFLLKPKFPASSELTGIFRRLAFSGRLKCSRTHIKIKALRAISLHTRTGNLLEACREFPPILAGNSIVLPMRLPRRPAR